MQPDRANRFMVGPSSVIPDPASLHLPCNPASFSLLFGLGRGSSKSLPRNDFQAMKWVAPPCILSKITLQNFPRGLDLVPGNAVGHPLPKAATPNAPPHAAIKALCAVLHGDRERRDSGLALFEAFDSIDLMAIQDVSGQSGDSTALRLIASSKLIRTTYKFSDSKKNHIGG
jgi:hypothetical protein